MYHPGAKTTPYRKEVQGWGYIPGRSLFIIKPIY